MDDIFSALPVLLDRHNDNEDVRRAVVFAVWRRIAGESLVGRAVPFGLDGSRLKIAVADRNWQRNIEQLAKEMIFKMNYIFGRPEVKFIEFVIDGDALKSPSSRTDRAEREAREAHALSQRVSLIIDALNSTAIDVSKILSNDAGDAAWAAYLKGDRGVFTRRAVRLLDSGEAREILRHYEEEPEFRDQVNRYIADFETMLRRVLADADGSALGITLLSSDMGKLYVALAQAIERLRR